MVDPAHSRTRGSATTTRHADATTHDTDEKPQSRTIMWVIAGIIVLAAIIWAVSSGDDGADQNMMDRRGTEQGTR